jgi:hypothetical protein
MRDCKLNNRIDHAWAYERELAVRAFYFLSCPKEVS